MATPPSSRGSSLDYTLVPASPASQSPFKRSTGSVSIPKSECLRNALEARRAQNTPVEIVQRSALASRSPVQSTALKPLIIHRPATSPDEFDKFDLPDEIMTPESPIRRRRHHDKDDTPPRGKTNQELSAEVEKLRNELFKQNIRVELLNKSNHELQAKWVLAKEEVDQLKPLEEENYELRMENTKLTERLAAVQDDIDNIDEMHDEIDKLYLGMKAAQEANEALTDTVENLSNVNKEAIANMHETEDALNEAVEMITSLENEKSLVEKEAENLKTEKLCLKNELDILKMRVAAIESNQVDGSEHTLHAQSIDDHRPATSYDDSDYYSQPATPRAGADKDAQSIRSISSARSRHFIELTRKRTRSARSLSRRLSDASLRAKSVVSAVHIPGVPYIPEECSQVTPVLVDERFRQRRYHQDPDAEQIVVEEPHRPATVTPGETHQPSGPCSFDRPEVSQHSRTLSHNHAIGPRSSQPVAGILPATPPRMSSRRAHTTSYDRPRVRSHGRAPDHNTMDGAAWGLEEQKQEQVLTAWTSANPRTSTVSMLISPRIDRPDKERWWKDTENVRPLRARATTRTLRVGFSSEEGDSASETFASREEGTQTNPATPATEKPEPDFLFNPRENEEQFMRKALVRLRGSIRRRHDASA